MMDALRIYSDSGPENDDKPWDFAVYTIGYPFFNWVSAFRT